MRGLCNLCRFGWRLVKGVWRGEIEITEDSGLGVGGDLTAFLSFVGETEEGPADLVAARTAE
jgi:hypothetical protein